MQVPTDPDIMTKSSCKRSDSTPDLPNDNNETVTINANDYHDLPEPKSRGPGGRPADSRLIKLAVRCYKKGDPMKATVFRCIGTNSGCQTAWKAVKRSKQRILNHSATCEHIPRDLREGLDGGLAKAAPSAKLRAAGARVAAGPLPQPSHQSDPCQPSVYNLAKKARLENLTTQLDADVVQFFCVGGIAPSKANLPQWRTIWQHAVPSYSPASASKLEEYHIPAEAAFVRTKQLEHLRSCSNLSITFDGQTIRSSYARVC